MVKPSPHGVECANLLHVYEFVIPFALPTRPMTRIEITAAAYAALDASATRGLVEPRRSPQGGYSLWLAPKALRRLEAVRRPYESYSVAILRLAKKETVVAT
jgi:hypothetical protein